MDTSFNLPCGSNLEAKKKMFWLQPPPSRFSFFSSVLEYNKPPLDESSGPAWQTASPVLQRETGQLGAVVDPFKLQWPAAFRHASQHQPVPLQVQLTADRLRLEVGRHVVCKQQHSRAQRGSE